MKKSWVFLGTFLVALVAQSFIWQQFEFVDKYMWIDQAHDMQTGNPRQYNALLAYGHPGTVLMVLTILTHTVFKLSYTTALIGSLTILNALIIAGIAVVSHQLKPNSLWWIAATGLVMFNRLLPASTPTSAVVSPLIVLLVLLTWLLDTRSSNKLVIWWGIVLGLAVATRADISLALGGVLWLFLIWHIGWRRAVRAIPTAVITFIVFDPFMWYMPIQHLLDLYGKVHYHYAEFAIYHLSPLLVILISPLAIISLLLGIIFLAAGRSLPQPIPRLFLGLLLLITIGLSAIFLTSHFQAQRYFFPLAFLWEVLLPLFLLELIPRLRFDFLKSTVAQQKAQRLISVGLVTLLVAGQAVMVVHLWLIPTSIFVCLDKSNPILFCKNAGVTRW